MIEVRALREVGFLRDRNDTIVESVRVDEQGHDVPALLDEDFADAWLRSDIGNYVHAVGTCRMGPADDPLPVVDTHCRAHGHTRLRVIDASIMPDVPRANTHTPTVMSAEPLAEAANGAVEPPARLKRRRGPRPEHPGAPPLSGTGGNDPWGRHGRVRAV
ncbi:GMC oxidoreductase [[Kitasatospora] papulosa]|uniref:GMC oxidoreductase n=1 Tax=[Kitasatospora] papulosa TaxID=1464011 RepID=UPI0036C520ED